MNNIRNIRITVTDEDGTILDIQTVEIKPQTIAIAVRPLEPGEFEGVDAHKLIIGELC